MFTGLIQAVGRVEHATRTRKGGGLRLAIDPCGWSAAPPGTSPAEGDSIAIAGVCLTLSAPIEPKRPLLRFDVIPETLAKTTLGRLRKGDPVNLEHAATLGTLLGGHLVQGHVDGVGLVESVRRRADDWRIHIDVPASVGPEGLDLMAAIVPKGSITLDGVSLTVVGTWCDGRSTKGGGEGAGGFSVALIPTTLAKTTLKRLKSGDHVNLETDVIGKTVAMWMRRYTAGAARSAKSKGVRP
ncbi:MAG: riboflavin synthase [Phycisphaerales bacterium]|nr:riboflavin synthase [Phycisphaerales bacterium]